MNIYWLPWNDPGCEHLSLVIGEQGVEAKGAILRKRDDMHFRCRYHLQADPDWTFRRLEFVVNGCSETRPRRLLLEHLENGSWAIDGQPAPQLAGCVDIDIQVTPFTNSLPIRRLALAKGESRDLTVAYVPLPDLAPKPVAQRYTCLAPLGEDGGIYRYEGLFRNFTADLEVDRDGVVMDYPDTFHRQWPRD